MNVVSLSLFDLSLAAVLVLVIAALSYFMQLKMSQTILIAAVRTVVQLLLVGLILKWVFAQTDFTWVGIMWLVMLLVAGYEIMARQTRRFKGLWGYGVGVVSVFMSSFAVGIFVLTLVVDNTPWYTPQYAIPLMGMIIGNTMTAAALSLESLTKTTWQQRMIIEARLALGQTWRQSISDIARQSVRIGMFPIVNAMAAAGLVTLPGMMSGQILGGTPPAEAVKYQILIMFMITAASGFATLIAVWLGARHLFDERQRLSTQRLHAER
ncbi:Probable iron export permease protein FetB [hydrothermal vent metagenome]|uniref:Probable iron export permease protein FetB n=1 Tax=hydrothermal vent metagenome TaxID=652676 RepID=A0A3B0ZCP9_9ZZZZ